MTTFAETKQKIPQMKEQLLFTVNEAASLIGVSAQTIRNRIKTGHIKACRLGGSRLYYIEKASIDKYLNKRRDVVPFDGGM